MRPETRSFYADAVQAAVEMVMASLDDALDLETLAERAALSSFHFHRIFRGMVGETPLQLHRRLRLERAASRLIHGDEPVTAVAFGAGYDTHEAFTRAFRLHFGRSPSAFRDRAPRAVAPYAPTRLPTQSAIHFELQPMWPQRVRLRKREVSMDVTIEERTELRVAAVRHVGPYHRIGEALIEFTRLAMAGGFVLHQPGPRMMALYYDDPETTPPTELRADAGMVVPEDAVLPDGLAEVRVPGGRYAVARHIGPYEGLPAAWDELMGQWLPASGERVGDGATYELFVSDPTHVPMEEVRTDLHLRLV